MVQANNINPSILTWARETAGLELIEAAQHLGIKPSETMSAEEKLSQYENGEKSPTRNLLTKFSSVYRRPLITFYMKEPPIRGERGEDFRRLSETVSRKENALLDALLRDIRARQEMVRELLEEDEDFQERSFVSSGRIEQGVSSLVTIIAKKLKFDYTSKKSRKGNADDLFRELRKCVEDIGVFVLLIGDLGSHHSALSTDVFRGFAIADKVAPFIVINDQDARAARSFTLLHELAHIWLGQSGVSGNPNIVIPTSRQEKIERFCNDVAGEFLLPTEELGECPSVLRDSDHRTAYSVVSGVAESWSVSEPMVAYRLNRIGWISRSTYQSLMSSYAVRWHEQRQKEKDNRQKNQNGPSYYQVKYSKLGTALISVVYRTLYGNMISHTKAAKVLGVKSSSVEPLLRQYEKRQHGENAYRTKEQL